MFERWLQQDPATQRALVVVGGLLVLVGSYFAAGWYLERTPPQPVAASEATTVPTTAPTVPAPEGSGPIVVHGTGDVLLDPRQLGVLASGYDAPWSQVRDLFTSDDLTVVNLECSPGLGGAAEDKEFTFRCAEGFAEMASNGIEVANLGNNHSGDYGTQALLGGRDRLARAGVVPVGAGRNALEANAPAIFERSGKRIAVLGFGGVVPSPSWIATPSRGGVADGYDTASMVRAVRSAADVADFVVVSLHWGAELDVRPRGDDVERARAMIDAGADAIFGHHAHVLQPLVVYKDRPIFYGLGNFVWPRGGPTAVARVVFRNDGTVTGCLLPGSISGGRPSVAEPESGCP